MADFPLKTYREKRELSQAALGRELGVSSVTVSRWEAGTRRIEKGLVPKIAEKTGIPARELRPDLAELIGEGA